MQQHETPQDNSLAVASLALGIFSLTGASLIAAIPAIVTGFMSLKNPVHKGFGIAGIIMGTVSIVITILFVLFVILMVSAGLLMAPEPAGLPAPGSSDYTPPVQQRA